MKSTVTVTRPANTDAYTAGDVVGGVLQLSGLPNGQNGFVTTTTLQPNIGSVPTGMTSFRLHLYSATPPSALADNAAWDRPSGDRSVYVGYIDLGTPVDDGSTLFVQATGINQHVKVGNTGLFAYLVTNGGFTPAANSETYTLGVYWLPE